jgi:hypothetical protein
LDVGARGLYDRIQRFLKILPEDGVTSGPVERWRRIFTGLSDVRTLARE